LGNNVTIEDVIRNELDLDEGDPFNYALYSRSINNIKSLNIFKSVSSEIVDTENSFEKIININVEEKPTGSISIGAGVGTSGASTSFGIQENNFLGKGIQLDTNLFLSEEVIRGLFSYTKKKYKNTNKDLIFSVQSQETDRMADFGYKSTDTGFSLGTNFEYLDDLYFSPNLLISSEKLDTADSASSMLKKQEGSYQNVDFRYRFFLNKLDKSFQPSDGFSSSFSQTIPINYGDNQTLVNVYEIKNYNEYMKDQVLSLSFYAAAANSLGNNDVRVSDRLYLPASKLRGFESGKIGPVDSGDFIGGNYSTAFNAKANLPVLQNLETMDFNLFYDAANVWGVDYSNSIDDSNKIRSSTGLSVDWYTPIGPMNFSLSQPITKSNTDKTEGFRFQLGTTF
jgi:outer membrane protein insertion porin family